MRIIYRISGICALLAAGTLLFCSFDDESNLGSGIINDADPDKVDLDKHIKEYLLDTSQFDSCYSIPRVGDRGFGVHDVSGSSDAMVIGRKNNEVATGLVRFLCTSDTNFSKGGRLFYGDYDSLISITLIFSKVSLDTPNAPRYNMEVFNTTGPYSFDTNNAPFDTLSFTDSSTVDSVTIPPGALRDSIYRSCRSLDTVYTGDTFDFGLRNISKDTLYRLKSDMPVLKVMVLRREAGKKDTMVFKPYYAIKAFYICQEDRRDTLQMLPVSSYGPSRTAVFKYNATPLWKAMEDSSSGKINDFISALFVVRHPRHDTSQIYVKCIVNTDTLSDARRLDSMFNTFSAIGLKDSLWSLTGNVRKDLQIFSRSSPRPQYLYLFVRLDCDRSTSLAIQNTEQWRSVFWDQIPYLKTIIHLP